MGCSEEESILDLQDNFVAVTGACTVRASCGALLLGSCYGASLIFRRLYLSGHFLHQLYIPALLSNHPSPTKALFFRRIKAQIVYLFQGQSVSALFTQQGALAFMRLQQLDLSTSFN